jgi:hypothetical protein
MKSILVYVDEDQYTVAVRNKEKVSRKIGKKATWRDVFAYDW